MDKQNVVISAEYLNKIRGFTAIDPTEQFTYVPLAWRELPNDLRAKFFLRPISGEKAAVLSDMMRGDVSWDGADRKATVHTKRGAFVAAVCREGVMGWETYYDNNGKCIEWKSSLDPVPHKLLEELADVIVDRASLTEEELLGLK